ncbi:MAG: hypothetical protein V4574_19240 [Pseudomonadota bacterium]
MSDNGARTSAWLFSFKAAAATIGGALLTFCVTIAQTSYQHELETLQRQREQGVAFQDALLRKTGDIENEIIRVSSVLKDTKDEAAFPADLLSHLDTLNNGWRLDRLPLRVRGAQIYGNTVGDLIYDPGEEAIDLDKCSIQVPIDRREGGGNCTARQAAEIARLDALVRQLRNAARHGGTPQWRPAGFQANFRMARKVLRLYVACRLNSPEARHYPCPPPGQMRQTRMIFERRVDLLVLSRERISTEIIRGSVLE